MADPRPPPPVPDLSAPSGPPAFAWFAGVVEGDRGGADGGLHSAAAAIERLGLGRADLELEGARFTLLLSGETIGGERLDEGVKQAFIAALGELARAAGASRPLESTLRCTEVHADRTVETLFAFDGDRIRPLSRVRAVDAEDRRRARRSGGAHPPIAALGRRRTLLVLALLAAIAAIATWRSGIVGGIFGPDPAELPILTTEFGDRLAVTARRSLGGVRLEIRRSPTYPDTEEELELWRSRLSGARERIAWQLLSARGTAYVHVLDAGSSRLGTVAVDLEPVTAGRGAGIAVVRLRGDLRMAGFALSPVEPWGK